MTEKEAKKFILSMYPLASAERGNSQGNYQVIILSDGRDLSSKPLSEWRYTESFAWMEASRKVTENMLERFES